MQADISNPIFQDADKAREALEAIRWPDGPFCPHCGCCNPDKISKIEGAKKTHRPGLYYCNDCKGQFTVTVGTVFERSKIALNKWLLATYLLSASKKGVSSHQLHRMLDVTYKTAWFMTHRIREAMKPGFKDPLGGAGKVVEADETYIGKKDVQPTKPTRGGKFTKRGKSGGNAKRIVVSLVERGGNVRSFHVEKANIQTVRNIVVTTASRESRLHTDESPLYTAMGREFERHETVNHGAKEYARGDVTTNTVEGFFGVFKRGMIGTYQHCGEAHLHRYLAEFDFRYNARKISDAERAERALAQIEGKRLTYRRIGEAAKH